MPSSETVREPATQDVPAKTERDPDTGNRRWPRYWLALIVFLAAILRLWRLDRNGYGNQYYSAGIRSMMESWHNFFFNAFDPAGFVSLDKPPVAFWIQVASAEIFGFSGLSILVPQAIEGILSVALLYHLVARGFGARAGLLAAFFLAITPISIAVDRSSNTDSCLALVLLLAAWALLRAVKTGKRRDLLLSAVLLGLGFNVKMLAAFIVIPTFVLVYFIGVPLSLRRRIGDLALAAIVVAIVSFSWTLAFDLTPPDHRPFAGSTTENSMLELVIGHNGLQRFIRRNTDADVAAPAAATPAAATPQAEGAFPDATVPPGPLRLFDPRLASQFGWLMPLAILGMAIVARQGRWRQFRPGTVLWCGWAITYGVVYSCLTRFSPYYLSALAPALCAMAGIGAMVLWTRYARATQGTRYILAACLLTAAWQIYVELGYFAQRVDQTQPDLASQPAWPFWLSAVPVVGVILCIGAVVAPRALDLGGRHRLTFGAMTAAFVTLLAIPVAWAVSGTLAAGNVARPLVNPIALTEPTGAGGRYRGDANRNLQDDQKLIAFLTEHRGDAKYLLATLSARQAAPVIIQTGAPVAALGGFSGSDPIVTPETLAHMVEQKQLRFVMLGGSGNAAGFGLGDEAAAQRTALEDWIRAHGTPVEPEQWRAARANGDNAAGQARRRRRPAGTGAVQTELYDLAPDGLASAPGQTPPVSE